MPCYSIQINGSRGIICARGVRSKKCKWCKQPGLWLCDHPLAGKKRKTCDAPMCSEHRTPIGLDEDYCPDCAQELTMNDLQKLAQGLKRLAVEKAEAPDLQDSERYVRHTLPHGLRIALRYKPGEWLIAFWRLNSVPSEDELKTCRRDFQIPSEALRSPELTKKELNGRDSWHGFSFSYAGPKDPLAQPEITL